MNFRILGASVLAATLLFTACGTSTLSDPLTREYETYVGNFKSLGSINVSDEVTHLFETTEGEVLYAFSDRYDLNEYKTSMEAYGIVTTYEELDKPLFEVTRLTEADETTVTAEEVTKVEYRNAELGVISQIYSNWEVESNASTGLVSFSIPHDAPETSIDETELNDTIDLVFFSNALSSTADATSEERASDIKNYVIQNYQDLDALTPEQVTVGVDKITGLRYKTATGDIYVFIPRASDLLELSYHYLYMDDALRIQNANLFSGFLNDFRFIASGMEAEDDPVAPTEEPASSVTQVEISKFATLSSTSFAFSMSYPAAWYYVGGSTGYSFDDEAIEEVTAEAIIKMDFNTGASDGTVRNGDLVSITKKVDSRTYTLTGSSEYETLMKTMLDSIQTTKAE